MHFFLIFQSRRVDDKDVSYKYYICHSNFFFLLIDLWLKKAEQKKKSKKVNRKLCYFLLLTVTYCSYRSNSMATPQLTQRYVCVGQSHEKASLRANLVRRPLQRKFIQYHTTDLFVQPTVIYCSYVCTILTQAPFLYILCTSSCAQKGLKHGYDTLPLHGKARSAMNQNKALSLKLHLSFLKMKRWRKQT